MSPVYVRGEVYLAAHRGAEAATEFRKILNHRGIVLNEPIGALAHLQIGRAYAMEGEISKAKAAYRDFLTLWKDADPNVSILKQAEAEYAKLEWSDPFRLCSTHSLCVSDWWLASYPEAIHKRAWRTSVLE